MLDKKALYSFFATLTVITLLYAAVSADNNNRAAGFGGELPTYSSLAQELIYSNDFTSRLYENSPEILRRVKYTLPPEGMLVMTFGEQAAESFKRLCR